MNMKKIYGFCFLILLLCTSSCASSFEQFYNRHKHDPEVTAVQLPRFVRNLLGTLSPEMNQLFRTVQDFRFISINNTTTLQNNLIRKEINMITTNRFTDILRKNTDGQQKIVSVLEDGDVIKKLLIFNSFENKNTALYLKGNFNPLQIKKLSKGQEFDNLIQTLTNNYSLK